MTAILPRWMKIDDALGDLSHILPELETFAKFAANWREIALAVRSIAESVPIDSPDNLAKFLASNINDPNVTAVFENLGLAKLHTDLAKVGSRFLDPTAPWAKLLRSSNEFVETYTDQKSDGALFDDGDNAGLVALQIPKLATDTDTDIAGGTLSFAIDARAGLACEAGSVWPFRGDEVPNGLLRIGASGKVQAKGGFSLPFGNIGKSEVDSEASAEAQLDFFFRPKRADIAYAEAVAGALTSLPNPLSLSDLNHAVQIAGMEGVTLYCHGAASAGLSAMLGTDYKFKQLASVSAGIVAGLNFKRNAQWILSLRNTSKGLRFVLSRNLERERDWSVGVDIGVDYSGLARQVHDALANAQDFLGPKLDAVRPFLSPGTYLANQLNGQLNAAVVSIISEPALKVALAQDIGLVLGQSGSKESALFAYVRDKIIDLAASQAGGVLAETEQWARHVADGLAVKFPGLSDATIVDSLINRLKPTLSDAKTQFDALVTSLVGQADIDKALADIGIKLDKSLKKADMLAAGVRALVAEFDSFSRKILEKTGEGISHKLSARFTWSGSESRGLQYELMGHFDEVNEDTIALWRALVSGQLEPFQRILANPDSAPSGFQLDPTSSLARFAGNHKGFALEIVAFGAAVSMKSIVTSEAKIALSAGGDVTVFAKGTAEREVDGFDEGRSASFVSVWELALHKADDPALGGQRKMGLSLRFDHDDKKLKSKEVTDFLGSLRKANLIEQRRVDEAELRYQKWKTAAPPGKKIKGQIDVSFSLTATAISRMIAIGTICGTDGSVAHRNMFIAAVKALRSNEAVDIDQFERNCRDVRKDPDYKPLAKVEDCEQLVYALRHELPKRNESSATTEPSYRAFGKLIELSSTFPRILSQMALIYNAIPIGATGPGDPWTDKDYMRAERALANDARKWLRLNQKLIFWFDTEIHPAMLAFLRLLADMNQVMVTDDPLEGLQNSVDATSCDRLFSITMTGPDGKAVSI